MNVAIMQPYFLPYLGYFQLMAAVDNFILLDDVSFIKRGWINRNRLLLNGSAHTFTIPLQGASQNKLICETKVSIDGKWKTSLAKTISHAYSKAPYFRTVEPLIMGILAKDDERLDEFIFNSLLTVTQYIGLNTEIVRTTRNYDCGELAGQERILQICLQESAQQYVNAIGGRDLYDPQRFKQQKIKLRFLQPELKHYDQGGPPGTPFVPGLSILDVLMFNSPSTIREMLSDFELI